jgi:LysR family hydrogen peroxide-inducible transcriptional activator
VLFEVEALLEVSRHIDPLAGRLDVGVIPTIAPYLLPDLDPGLREAFPGLTLAWREDKTETLVRLANRGELDAALLALEADLDDLEHEVVGDDPFILATAPSHPLARVKSPVRMKDLRGEDVLLLDEGHCFREQALDLCSRAGAHEMGFRATSLPTLSQMVAAGTGVTLLPELAVDVENRRGLLALRPFADPPPKRTIVLAWRRGSALADALRRLAREAAAIYARAA